MVSPTRFLSELLEQMGRGRENNEFFHSLVFTQKTLFKRFNSRHPKNCPILIYIHTCTGKLFVTERKNNISTRLHTLHVVASKSTYSLFSVCALSSADASINDDLASTTCDRREVSSWERVPISATVLAISSRVRFSSSEY